MNNVIKNKSTKGFTLVELIVVIAILMVLAVLAVVAFGNLGDAAEAAAIRTDASRLAAQLNNFNEALIAGTGTPVNTRITTGNIPALANNAVSLSVALPGGATMDFGVVFEPGRTLAQMTTIMVYTNNAWSLAP